MKISYRKHNCERVFKSGMLPLQDNGVLHDFRPVRLLIKHRYANNMRANEAIYCNGGSGSYTSPTSAAMRTDNCKQAESLITTVTP